MNNKLNLLIIVAISFLLISCGGGGGGSGGGALVQTPTYTQYVDFINNGGTIPSVQGKILRSKGINPNTGYANNTEFESLSSITLQYSVPDANGNQSISMSGTVNWDGDPFSGSDTFTGTFDGSEYYDLFLDDHLASVNTLEGDTVVYTIGFVDFGEPRTVEQTKYVTQLMQYREPRWEGLGDFDYDFLAFVMGDQTWAADMPSSGSATYNGFAQMLMSFKVHELEGGLLFYNNGTSTFTADFATRNITGRLEFDYDAAPWDAANGIWADPGETFWWFPLEGTISGTSFSGTTSYDFITGEEITSGGETISFTGNFYGPNATELGGIFTYSAPDLLVDGYTTSTNAIGTFTACQDC